MCDVERPRLIAWSDGELPEAESLLVKKHVGACADCGAELRRIKILSSEITSYCAAVGGEQRRKYWIPAAAAAVVLAAGLAWMRPQPPKIPVAVRPPSISHALAARIVESPQAESTKPRAIVRRLRPRAVKTVAQKGGAGLTVLIPLDEVLPFGAAPPGSVLVGNLTFDAGGQLSRIQLQ